MRESEESRGATTIVKGQTYVSASHAIFTSF